MQGQRSFVLCTRMYRGVLLSYIRLIRQQRSASVQRNNNGLFHIVKQKQIKLRLQIQDKWPLL